MTHIKIEVPANDHIALSAMAEALNRIAAERGPSIPVRGESHCVAPDVLKNFEVYKPFSDESEIDESTEHTGEASVHHENTKLDVEFEEVVESINSIEPTPAEQDDILDADGLPWDNRIHSRGKTRLSDDTWRLARKPNDKTDEEWSTYVESVKSELKAVQDIPKGVIQGSFEEYLDGCDAEEAKVLDKLTPPVIDEPAIQFEGVTPNGDVVIEPPVTTVGAPVAPLTPPTSLTPPVVVTPIVEAPVTSNQPSVTTFQELMLYITGNAKKRGADNELIKSTLLEVDPALVAIPLIATRADLIPKFVTALEAKLS